MLSTTPDSINFSKETARRKDQQLIEGIISGNTFLAFLFLKKECRYIFHYINHTHLKNLDLKTDDLIHDFYIFLQQNNWEKLRSFRCESKLETWIQVVASRFLIKKYLKELKEYSKKVTQIDQIRSTVDDGVHQNIVRVEILDCISKLKDKRAQHVLLMLLNGYEPLEIAAQLNISVNNVYILKSRAIDQLKVLLK